MANELNADEISDLQILVGGRWQPAETDRWANVFNPSTGRVIARAPLCSSVDVNRAVAVAASALPKWAETPVVERAHVMFQFRNELLANFEEIARLITQEHGKTRAEARASLQRGIEMVEFACGIPSLIMGQCLENIATGVDAETSRHPVGVCVGITPFNFPAMVPLWMFPVAITCGNTFILKPSEKVPLAITFIARLLQNCGLPDGIFNLIHGDKGCADALLTHPLIRAISFVGSTPVAQHIYQTGTFHGKRVQAAGGAKNHLIIMPDADLDQAVKAVQGSAFGCAGERCMAGSVAVSVGNIGDDLIEGLVTAGSRMKVGPTDTNAEVDMGPVISREHRDRVASYLDIAAAEEAVVALDGRKRELPSEGFFLGPSIVDRVQPEMRLAKEEIFGPVLSVVRATDLDHALSIGRNCEHGNGASIFTRSGHAARQFRRHFNAGMIGINVGVPTPMAWFPFTGWNRSFFGDLHIQGQEAIQFYTQQKSCLTRWFDSSRESAVDPIWKAGSDKR